MDKEQTTTHTMLTEAEAVQLLIYRHALEAFYFRMHDDSAGKMDEDTKDCLFIDAIINVASIDPSIARFFQHYALGIITAMSSAGIIN